jgi:hypothetical protein
LLGGRTYRQERDLHIGKNRQNRKEEKCEKKKEKNREEKAVENAISVKRRGKR